MRAAPVLRSAVEADADFLAWALQEASGGLFGTLLGRRAESILATVVAQRSHDLSYEHAVIAESDGVRLGMCHGMPSGTASAAWAVVRVAGLRTVRAAAVVAAGWPLFAALDRHEAGEWYLQALAVRSDARGAGTGQALLGDAFTRAARAGCSTVTLDVDAANDRARALYERKGLRVTRTSAPAALLDGARVHRMTADVPRP